MLIRCGKESHHPAESWAAGPPVEHLENEKDATLRAIRVGVNILQFMFGRQLLLTRKRYNKVRGKYIAKEVFTRPLSLCRCDSACM